LIAAIILRRKRISHVTFGVRALWILDFVFKLINLESNLHHRPPLNNKHLSSAKTNCNIYFEWKRVIIVVPLVVSVDRFDCRFKNSLLKSCFLISNSCYAVAFSRVFSPI
jgi:hypothetical protein